ncbi:MAG: response regulator transcription factor [Oceanidesulfovibrio sp.]
MAETTLLLIEDDLKLQKLLKEYLGTFGFELHAVTHPEEGLKAMERLKPSLVILDVMLPGMNGFEVCRRIRQSSYVPVVMLTARGEVPDRVAGLEIGADDYILKPFEPRELVARIQTVLRRSKGAAPPRHGDFGRLHVDFEARAAFLDNRDLELTTSEFNALAVMARNAGRVVSRDVLLQELRGLDAESFNRSVDIAMSRLRSKLGDNPKSPQFIKTVWGEGYMLLVPDQRDD